MCLWGVWDGAQDLVHAGRGLYQLNSAYEVSVEGSWLMFTSLSARWSLSGLSVNPVGGDWTQ